MSGLALMSTSIRVGRTIGGPDFGQVIAISVMSSTRGDVLMAGALKQRHEPLASTSPRVRCHDGERPGGRGMRDDLRRQPLDHLPDFIAVVMRRIASEGMGNVEVNSNSPCTG